MIIDCISDLHGEFPFLEGGDLLIIAGDLTSNSTQKAWDNFTEWLEIQPYKKIILIAGNHDKNIDFDAIEAISKCQYLEDFGTEFEGLNIWGCPWTPWFEGVNPHCTEFMIREYDLYEKYQMIPMNTDILITHGPPRDILDGVYDPSTNRFSCEGSPTLKNRVEEVSPMYHIFGHIHEGYGRHEEDSIVYINCAHMDGDYEPVNKPIRIEI